MSSRKAKLPCVTTQETETSRNGRDPLNQNFRKINGSVRSNRKSFEKTGPPFEVDHFSRSDRFEFWLNGSRPLLKMLFKKNYNAMDSEENKLRRAEINKNGMKSFNSE